MTSSEEDIDDGWDVVFMGKGLVTAYIYKGPSLSELKEFGRADGLFSKRVICRSWKTYGASQLRKLGIQKLQDDSHSTHFYKPLFLRRS